MTREVRKRVRKKGTNGLLQGKRKGSKNCLAIPIGKKKIGRFFEGGVGEKKKPNV